MQDSSNDTNNYVGALLFWLYIMAALAFTGLITTDIWTLQSAAEASGDKIPNRPNARIRQQRAKAHIFWTLSIMSFSILSFHMLYFLIDHYKNWAIVHQAEIPRDLFDVFSRRTGLNIWKWSHTSTLFQDFAKELCENPQNYWWTSQALIFSFQWNMLMAVQGKTRCAIHLQPVLNKL